MNYVEEYSRWLKYAEDEGILAELEDIEGKEAEIEDRFYRDLEFGTAGLRGIIGAGTNRMNIYTVGRATQGYSDYLNSRFASPSAAIAYDSRIKSRLFAETAAAVFAANGVKVHLYPVLMPTPALSFAVRDLNCSGGVVVTASHNPSDYNGYKVYGPDGCQITSDDSEAIQKAIDSTDWFTGIRKTDFDEALASKMIEYIGDDTADRYLEAVSAESLISDGINKDFAIVYTPLNGAGISCVPKCLEANGFTNITIPDEQKEPDGNFPTCPYPNPETREALEVGLKWAEKVEADLLLATDPDCDRVGIAVRKGDEYRLLTGNETGVLLLDYICRMRTEHGIMPEDPVAMKTIVTTPMAAVAALSYGVETVDLLTGFKYIGEQIRLLEEKGQEQRFIFGFEESYGYLSGSFVRDKDAVNACLMICEMFAYHRAHGLTLTDVLDSLYEKHGYYQNTVRSFAFEGNAGFEKMNSLMDMFRNEELKDAAGFETEAVADYRKSLIRHSDGETEKILLPKSNVIRFFFRGGNEAVLRPSGTEPKLKLYVTSIGNTIEESRAAMESIMEYFSGRIQ